MTSFQEFHVPTPQLSPQEPATITISNESILRLQPAPANPDVESKIQVTSGPSTLVGILNQKEPGKLSKKVALILHGILAHKNQTYHRKLANRLPIDSFRFDFNGNHESSGQWKVDGISNDVQDISDMVHYLEQNFGYEVDLVIAHSRGALAAWNFFTISEEFHRGRHGSHIPHLVSLSARWNLGGAENRSDVQEKAFKEKGFFSWKLKVGGEVKEYVVTKAGVERFAQFPIKKIVANFPTNTQVLLLHGTKDNVVPTKDAFSYFDKLRSNPGRSADKVELQLIEGADHLYKTHQEEVVDAISQWYHRKTTAPFERNLAKL